MTEDPRCDGVHLRDNIASQLYESVVDLPLVCPHGHVDPRLFVDPSASFGSPADLFVLPDHYVTRMLYSQGIPLESVGIPPLSCQTGSQDGLEYDHRKIWQLFCANFHLFRGTPSGIWLIRELKDVFNIEEKPCKENADGLYDAISEKLTRHGFSPRALYKQFNIEALFTTDLATDPLENHRAIRASGWNGRIMPTFRPDTVVNLDTPGWQAEILKLSLLSGIDVVDYPSYILALEERRGFFKSMGATATDHAAFTPTTADMSPNEAGAIFQRALKGSANDQEAARFTAHMLIEMARMSLEDGLVMQLHVGVHRNHNKMIFERFGPNMGADIPLQTEYTRNLFPLLNKFGNDRRLTLIVFTLDETAYSRELAPLAGHYPAMKLGPPWWFHDSPNGIGRYFNSVMETAGIYNTVGFNDDTRAFCSIPARHDLWRRASANWLSGLVSRHIIDLADGQEMMGELAAGLAKRAYKL
jgi:glucuronate isomerase